MILYRSPWLRCRHQAGRRLRFWAIRIGQGSRQLVRGWPGRVRAELNDLRDRDPGRSRPRILVRYGRLLARRAAAYIFFQMRFYRMQSTVREMTFPVLPPPRIKDLEVRELSIKDIPLFRPWLHRMKPEDLIGRFGKGDRCWAAITGGGVVGYLWSTDRDHYEQNSGTHLRVLPGETYLYDGGVVEAYRNKGMINYILDSLLRDPAWEPDHAFFAWVEISNHVPQKTMARFNFKAQYILGRRRCFGIGRTVIEPAPENVPLRTRGSRSSAKHR